MTDLEPTIVSEQLWSFLNLNTARTSLREAFMNEPKLNRLRGLAANQGADLVALSGNANCPSQDRMESYAGEVIPRLRALPLEVGN